MVTSGAHCRLEKDLQSPEQIMTSRGEWQCSSMTFKAKQTVVEWAGVAQLVVYGVGVASLAHYGVVVAQLVHEDVGDKKLKQEKNF